MCEGHTVTGYFYNPNIHPEDEYRRRLDAAEKAAAGIGFELIEGPYDRERWFTAVKGLEYDKEGGGRCLVCYEMRLRKTFETMKKKGFGAFTTTLTLSPHKCSSAINEIGRKIDEDHFILCDFKKKGGFSRAGEIAVEIGIYRQNYCGCIYSLEESYERENGKKKKTDEAGGSGQKG